jgi:hypothetical protein
MYQQVTLCRFSIDPAKYDKSHEYGQPEKDEEAMEIRKFIIV